MEIVISLLVVILIISSIGGLIIYMQIKKSQNVTSDPIAQDFLKMQVEALKEQLNDFKISWNGSDRDKTEKLINLIDIFRK